MRFYLLSLGCPKNSVDSEAISRELASAGHHQVSEPGKADLLLVNTCGFIAPAKEESLNALLQLASSKRNHQKLVAVGCLSQRYAQKLKHQVPQLDLILGIYRPGELTQRVAKWQDGHRCGQVDRRIAPRPSAYLKIADGCSAGCAFCVIPQIKGPYHSLPPAQLIAEAQRLVAEGARELVLVAQDTTAYGQDWGQRDGLPLLLEQLAAALSSPPWIRVMYAHPSHVTPHLIETMARLPQVCPYLDMPLQHAHPDVLRRMRRPADPDRAYRLIESLRQALPNIALRTSFIVGYPGETEAEFQILLDFIQEVRFDRLGVFRYSREEGTEAAALPNQVPEPIKEERYHRLMALQQQISLERNRELVGRELEVLVESLPQNGPYLVGRSYRDAPEVDGLVFFPGQAQPGDIIPVRVTAALEYDLMAEPVPD